MKIKKAIIPAGGLGTRFLPATKALPKEMLPIVDKPTIQYIVEEAIASGIEDIIIISGRNKRSIEDHFDKSIELEETLLQKEKHHLLQEIQGISSLANIYYVRQKEPKGLGHAIHCAKSFIGNEPFAVLLGDDITYSTKPFMKQLIDVFDQYHSSVVGVQQVPDDEVANYGIIKPNGDAVDENIYILDSLVEKPKLSEAPSRMAVIGRYILTPQIFDILCDLPPDISGEIQLTDAIKVLSQSQRVLAYHYQGQRYDIGNKLGFIEATIDFALQREDLKNGIIRYLKEVVKKYETY